MKKSTTTRKAKTAAAPNQVARTPPTPNAKAPGSSARSRTRSAASAPAVEPTHATAAPKHKLVRDSFTIPKSEYVVLDALKLRAAKLGRPSKKSEVIRAGINALNAMNDKALLAALGVIPSIKTGRPKSSPTAES